MNKVSRHRFKAFDTEIELCLISEKGKSENMIRKIERAAVDFEKRFSRFDAASELNKINDNSGKEIKVSAEMLELLLEAKKAYRMTKGLFDPTILSVLSRIGYDKSFGSLTKGNGESGSNDKDEKKFSFKNFVINEKDRTIKSPAGLKIDLGGIGKGFWVDQMKDLLDQHYKNYWISAGGDISIKGKNEKNESWQVTVQNPLKTDEDILCLNIPGDGYGVATSGITKRQGIKNGKKWNHLIDTRTNNRVKNSVLSVTVIARTATEADVMAKTVLILGVKNGLASVNNMEDCECVIIDKNLKMQISGGLKKFL